MAKPKPNKFSAKIQKAPINSKWFNNVAKSMGALSADIIKEMVPNTSDFLESNASDAMEMVREMRSNVGNRTNVNRQITSIPQIAAGKDILKNVLEDIKSGNINNTTRPGGFDDDMDFGFGDLFDDLDIGESLEFSEGNETGGQDVTVNQYKTNNVLDTLPLAKAMQANTEATISAISAVSEQNIAMESEKFMFTHKSMSTITNGLSAINDNLATLVKFHGDSTAKYYSASIQYYEESINELKKITARYQKQVEEAEDKRKANMDGDGPMFEDSVWTYTGGLNMKEYVNAIKSNINTLKEENAAFAQVADSLTSTQGLKMLASNPLGFMAKMGMKSLIPVATKTAFAAVDASVSSLIPAFITKINQMQDSDNPIYQYINKIFGTKNKLDYKVDLGEYNRGPQAWDGQDKKSLNEVIPTYLRRIEAAVTGHSERIYDYKKGVFVTSKELQQRYDEDIAAMEVGGYTAAQSKMRQIVQEMGASAKVMQQFEKDMTEYFRAVTKKGSIINPFKTVGKDGMTIDELMSEALFDSDMERHELFRKAAKGLSVKELNDIATMGIYDSRRLAQMHMDEIRKDPNGSGYATLNNGGLLKNGRLTYDPTKGRSDAFGNNTNNYLRDIRSILATGIATYDPRHNPHKKAIRRFADESTSSVLKDSSMDMIPNTGKNLEQLLSMNASDMKAVYAEINNDETMGKDNKISKYFGKKLGRVNEYSSSMAGMIDSKIFTVLFGDDPDNAAMFLNNKTKLEKMIKEDTGKGSILGNAIGFFQDTVKGVGAYFTGQGYTKSDGTKVAPSKDSIIGQIKSFFSGSVEKTIGKRGDKEDLGLMGKISKDFMDGFGQFKKTLFGEKTFGNKMGQETIQDLSKKVKDRLPKSIGAGLASAMVKTAFASKLGILGSVLLPGGPIGAALTGTTVSFLMQSETFKNWLFGEKDQEGQRLGGFIPKSLIDKINKNGGNVNKNMKIGAGAGLLASFFLPGGPITGAVMGMGAGMLTKHDKFQEFLYGKDFNNKDVKKSMANGTFGKLFKSTIGKAYKDSPKLATFLGGAGALTGLAQGVGLLPSFLLPGGPITGAMLGLAGGIVASSDKFQNFLFGDKETDGRRYGGIMTKFTNWFDTTVITPMQIKAQSINDNIYEFVQGKIVNPAIKAFEPMTQAFQFAVEDAKSNMSKTWHKLTEGIIGSFNDNVIKPFGESLEKYVVDPLKRSFNFMLKIVGKGLGTLVSAPIKLLTGIGNMANIFNERHVMKAERKNRRDAYKANIAQKYADGTLGFKDIFGGLKDLRISKQRKEEILNEEISYREGWESRDEERKTKLAKEMEKRRAATDELRKQYEEDVAYGKSKNWKYASKRQKEKHEEEVKKRTEWYQEQLAVKTAETAKKLNSIDDILKETPVYEAEKRELLSDIKDAIYDQLDYLKELNGDNVKANAKSAINKMGSKLTEQLKDAGQSHATGLDEVPKDGYIAELHEGEMVVPKKGAGFLRNIFGGNKENGKKNSIASALSTAAGFMGNMFRKDKSDRADNNFGFSQLEQQQAKELMDLERYQQVSRKGVDFVQAQMLNRKKEKEDKKFRNALLEAIRGNREEVKKGNSFWSDMFGANGLLGNLISKAGPFAKKLLSILGGLGGALAAAGGLAAAGDILKDKKDYDESGLKEEGVSFREYRRGVGDPERLDHEGLYQYNSKADAETETLLRVGGKKYGSKIIEGTKNTWTKGKNAVQAAKGGFNKFAAYANPTKTSKALMSTSYTIDLPRQGLAQKAAGKAFDVAKVTKTKAKDTMSSLVALAKKALSLLDAQIAKVPKLKGVRGIAGKVGETLTKLIRDADVITKKFSKKIALFFADGAADFIPLVGQIGEALMTGWDLLTGLTKGNTGNLFGVSKEDVTWQMQIISSALQGACKFSWFSIIWMINEITSDQYGYSFLQELAVKIYEMMPKNEVKATKLDSKLRDKGMNADNSDAEALLRAAVDPDMADEAVKELASKGLENITGKDLAKYGGSATDAQEISRAAYNSKHKTNMSSEAWKDKRSTTVWDKMVGGKTAKNIKGTFSKRSAIGHLGLNKDAQLTGKERRNFAFIKTGINAMNFGRKLFGKEEIDDKEIFQRNWFDENGRFTLNKKKQTQNYAQARTKKYQSRVDEANAKINERLEKEPKTGIGRWWNNMMIGVQKGKRQRARDKMGTDKKKKKTTNVKDNAKQAITNTKVKDSKELNNLLIDSGAMDSADSYSGGAGMGEGDSKKKSKKSGGSKNATASKKAIDKMHASFAKSIKKDANIITKGLSTGQKTLSKSFTVLQKALVSSGKVTSSRLKKEARKGEKDIDKMSKNLVKDAKKLFSALKDKVNKTVKDIKNIKITTAATVSPTFTVDNPKSFMTDLFSDVLKKVDEAKNKDKDKKKKNAGSSGIATNLAPKANKESGSFISPTTNNTTNNSTSNKFVFYSQNDDRWSNKQLVGDKTIAQAGCGPTSIAMAISQMTGEEVTPDVIAQLGKRDLPGYSTYNLFPEIARKFAMNYEDTEDASDIIRYLKEGTPVILSGISNGANGLTPYTDDGHVVVANSIQGDQVFVSDPRGKGYSRSYKIDDLLSGMNKAMVMKPTMQTKARLNGRTMGRLRGVDPQYVGTLNTELGKARLSPAQLKANFGSDGQMKLFEKVLAYAKLFEGKLTYSQPRRYDIDNNKLSSDCSSFTHHVFDRVAGIDIGATSGPQHNAGVAVPLDQAQAGDLIVFDGHAGIVWDNNQMIDIGSGMGPKIRSFRSSYWMGRNPKIRRVLTDPNQTVDNVVNRANSALGTNTVNGLNLQAVAGAPGATSGEAPAVEQLGVFAKMGQLGQNFVASAFNGREVDMFNNAGSAPISNTTTGTAQINGRTVKALFTSYYPENSKLQGGFLDAQGKPLDPSKNTCAAPKDIPFGAKIQIQGTGTEKDGQIYTVNDRGGAIKVRGDEYQFDLLSPNHDVAYSWGRKKGTAIISTDGVSAGKEPDSVSATSGSIPNSMNGWAYYTQYDPRWQGKNSSFGGATVSGQGCGPTSQAMMLTTMFGQQVTPDVMAEFGYKNGGWGRIGMDWGMPAKTAKKFGLAMPSEWAGNSKDTLDGIKSAIKGGTPVLMSGQGISQNVNSPFTTGGHLVLGVGVDGQNNIIINDPRGAKYTKAYTDEDMRRGKAGLRHAWAFAKTSASAIPSDITTGGVFTPGASVSGGAAGSAEAPSVEMMGAFDAANKVVQNYVASVFNGREVDMFASSGGTSTTGGSVDIGGINDTKQAVWKFFTGMGYSPQATAGIMGNLQQESTINPTLIQGNGRGPAAGIAQWENYNSKSARWKEMADHAASKGKEWTDLQSQLEFIDMELSGRSKDTYTASLLNKRYGGINALKSATDINTAADMFEKTFERAGKPMMANRYKYAKAIYDQFAGSAGSGEGDGKIHLIQPKVMKGAKPVTKIGKSPFKGMYEKAGAGMGEGPAKVKRAQQDILRTINNSFKLNRASNSAPAQQAATADAYIDILAQIVAELAAIRTNTGITAENTKEIKIASANEPINSQTTQQSKSPKSQVSQTEGKSVGYDMARAIASFNS